MSLKRSYDCQNDPPKHICARNPKHAAIYCNILKRDIERPGYACNPAKFDENLQ
jgi:hypothetical protein